MQSVFLLSLGGGLRHWVDAVAFPRMEPRRWNAHNKHSVGNQEQNPAVPLYEATPGPFQLRSYSRLLKISALGFGITT